MTAQGHMTGTWWDRTWPWLTLELCFPPPVLPDFELETSPDCDMFICRVPRSQPRGTREAGHSARALTVMMRQCPPGDAGAATGPISWEPGLGDVVKSSILGFSLSVALPLEKQPVLPTGLPAQLALGGTE